MNEGFLVPYHRKKHTRTLVPTDTTHIHTCAARPPIRICGGTTFDTNGSVDGMNADMGGARRGPCSRALFLEYSMALSPGFPLLSERLVEGKDYALHKRAAVL